MQEISDWLRSFIPGRTTIKRIEKGRSCIGAFLGIFLTGSLTLLILGPTTAAPLLIAPMGASAVLLFAVPSSPLAQPWSVIGGNTVSALVGVTAGVYIAEPFIASAVAVAGAIGAMFALRCLHPPGGAVALTAVVGGSQVTAMGYQFVLMPTALNSILILLIALIYNNGTRHRYPHAMQSEQRKIPQTADLLPSERLGFTPADLDKVLQQHNEMLDIGRDDLQNLFQQAEMQAYRRRFGEITCADIMSRDVITVTPQASLAQAWQLLLQHRIKALPVVDEEDRVAGILTRFDLMKEAGLQGYEGIGARLRSFIQENMGSLRSMPKTVGHIMTKGVHTALSGQPIVELVPLLCDRGLHQIPVVDHHCRLVGILTQSDLIAGLYRGKLADASAYQPTIKRVS